MFQASVAAPLFPRHEPDTQDTDLLDPLWRLAGDLSKAQALIVAEHGLDLMCGLIRRGCLAATVVRLNEKPDAGDYNMVFVPLVTSVDDVIRISRRALGADGRLVARVRGAEAAAALASRLRLNGFTDIYSIHLSGLVLLRAELRRRS